MTSPANFRGIKIHIYIELNLLVSTSARANRYGKKLHFKKYLRRDKNFYHVAGSPTLSR